MKKILFSFFFLFLFSFTILAQLLPPGFTNNGTAYDYTNNITPYVFPTNGLWLWITNASNGTVYANLNGATDYVYAILSATNLTSSWSIETEVFPGLNTNSAPFTLSQNGRCSVYLTAMDWTGITSSGNQTPLWWLFYWFGPTGLELSDTNLDSSALNDLLHDYANQIDPNIVQLAFVNVTNIYSGAGLTAAQLGVVGVPYYLAVLVDDTNFNDAVWDTYSSSNITINLGSVEGWHNVWVGLRGHADPSTNGSWQMEQLYLDLTPNFSYHQSVYNHCLITDDSNTGIQFKGFGQYFL